MHERIGDEQQQEEQGRGDEDRPQDLLAVEQLPHPGRERRAARGWSTMSTRI